MANSSCWRIVIFREMHESFASGFFTVSKSRRIFSKLAFDQPHKQNKKLVKVDRDTVGIFENEGRLLKWAVVIPSISDTLKTAIYVQINLTKCMTITKIKTNSIMIKRCFQRNVRKFWKSIFRSRTTTSSYHIKEIT